ncbi:UDP-2,4-diacetamido-2,4,6-trideoxy-beta-L-altropyranose hydrolase [Sporosarcina sp. 179-K 3D1 HS]|uniref:UDP-2,4-diacetamido-2,4, 6-trideoxy-beta-L-altropyranose hydrolase n=1 Tax=Sporosarcina sp. 179-K 3D1 HS TaxID=3232169 RepID=UPI0039A0FF85
MKVLIRTDASTELGSGHVMRCLTVAGLLRNRGCDITFMMEDLPGSLIEYVQAKGYPVTQKFQQTDLCIVDHYGIDVAWERSVRPMAKKIMVIDDLANRRHDCDLLIDQNMVPHYKSRYDWLVPEHCVQLLGPQYLIMRDEFIKERKKMRLRNNQMERLLVFMGGSDPTNETMKVLEGLEKSKKEFQHVDVVVGSSNVNRAAIERVCVGKGFHYHCQIDYMAELMGQADFSIGAGGSTTWERCYVGLPSSSTIVAENQVVATETAATLGVAWNLGWHKKVTAETYEELISSLTEGRDELQQMSELGLRLTASENPNPCIEMIMEMMQL